MHFNALAGKVSLLRPFLPFVLWSSLDPTDACVEVCLWVLLVFAFYLSVMLTGLSEERSRRVFLKQAGIPTLGPPLRMLVVLHAVVYVILFGAVIALALNTWRTARFIASYH